MAGRPRILVYLLLGRGLRHRYDGDVGAAFSFGSELNLSVDEREQRVILAETDIAAGMPFGAALARQDIAGEHDLAAGRLQAEPPARRVAAVSGRSACLFMCHECSLKFRYCLHRFHEGIISLFLVTFSCLLWPVWRAFLRPVSCSWPWPCFSPWPAWLPPRPRPFRLQIWAWARAWAAAAAFSTAWRRRSGSRWCASPRTRGGSSGCGANFCAGGS